METISVSKLVYFLSIFVFLFGAQLIQCTVTYDKKAIIINGRRRILLSGSIHYPRSTPEVFPHFLSLSLSFPLYINICCRLAILWTILIMLMKWVLLQMWEDLIRKAKIGGLDVIDTYVFWNVHEPSPGNVSVLANFLFSIILCLTLFTFNYCFHKQKLVN